MQWRRTGEASPFSINMGGLVANSEVLSGQQDVGGSALSSRRLCSLSMFLQEPDHPIDLGSRWLHEPPRYASRRPDIPVELAPRSPSDDMGHIGGDPFVSR